LSDARGRNALVRRYLTPMQDFMRTNVAGEHCWINPPYRQATAFLSHYLQCKAAAPDTTCALLVLPYWPRSKWWPIVRQFKAVCYYPIGTHLFTAPPDSTSGSRRRDLGPIRWPVYVFWDPPQGVVAKPQPWQSSLAPATASTPAAVQTAACQYSLIESDRQQSAAVPAQLIVLAGRNGGRPVKVLFDSGATHLLVSTDYVQRCGIRTMPSTLYSGVRMVDGTCVPARFVPHF
jgi:hypothetical protein